MLAKCWHIWRKSFRPARILRSENGLCISKRGNRAISGLEDRLQANLSAVLFRAVYWSFRLELMQFGDGSGVWGQQMASKGIALLDVASIGGTVQGSLDPGCTCSSGRPGSRAPSALSALSGRALPHTELCRSEGRFGYGNHGLWVGYRSTVARPGHATRGPRADCAKARKLCLASHFSSRSSRKTVQCRSTPKFRSVTRTVRKYGAVLLHPQSSSCASCLKSARTFSAARCSLLSQT